MRALSLQNVSRYQNQKFQKIIINLRGFVLIKNIYTYHTSKAPRELS